MNVIFFAIFIFFRLIRMLYLEVLILLVSIIVLFLVIFMVIKMRKNEGFENISLYDNISSHSTDPVVMKYIKREKDILGNSPTEYYLRNKTGYFSRVLPSLLEGDERFFNQDDYIAVKPEYRKYLCNSL